MLAMWVGVGVSNISPGSREGWRAKEVSVGASLMGERESGGRHGAGTDGLG